MKPITQVIALDNRIELHIRREDLMHPIISGNKFRKLKYNIEQAKTENHDTLLTFGGAFSNHIAAVAAAGKQHGLKTVGVIRGEELSTRISANPTLAFAAQCGMRLEFISRSSYRHKDDSEVLMGLTEKFGRFFWLPEGGTNSLAVKGCEEILGPDDAVFDYICCAGGTGGTVAGIINSSTAKQTVLAFSALKGDFLNAGIAKWTKGSNWKLVTDYHFGGYGKTTDELIGFINGFYREHKIPLDPIYTGKMLFGVIDLAEKSYFREGSKILAIHTGGLQGILGMNNKLKFKNLPLIEIDV